MIQMTIIHAFATTSATVEIGRIFIAIAVVISVSQIFGELLSRLSQPRVMGEILEGVALGPNLLGWLSPQLDDQLFGAGITDQLNLLGQLGLALFMFLVGLELQPSILKGKAKVAAVISLSGIVLPMVMGIGLGTVLDGLEPTLFPGDRRLDGALFMGTAMAITALPRRRSRVCELGASRGCGCVHSLWFNLGVRDSPRQDGGLGLCLAGAAQAIHNTGGTPLQQQKGVFPII